MTKLIIAWFTSTRGVYHKKEFQYFEYSSSFFSYGLKKAYSNDLLVQGWGTFRFIQFYPQQTHVLNQLLIAKFPARWGNMYNHKMTLIKMSTVAMCSKTIPILIFSLLISQFGFIDELKRFCCYDFDRIQPKLKWDAKFVPFITLLPTHQRLSKRPS